MELYVFIISKYTLLRFSVYPVSEFRLIGHGSYHEPVEHPVPEVSAVELVAELAEVALQELGFQAVVYACECCLGVRYGDVYPRKHLSYVLRLYHA